jgi:hypothetical protein
MFTTGPRRVAVAGIFLLNLGAISARGETNAPAVQPGSTNAAPVADTNAPVCSMDQAPPFRPWSVSGEMGTTGGGGNLSWRFVDHLGLRIGMDYFPFDDSRKIQDVEYNSHIRLLAGVTSVDVYPWKNSSFRVSFGALLNGSELSGSPNPNENVTIDGNTFTPAEVGTLNLKITPNIVDPYVAIGATFFNFDRAHHWSLGGEIGVAYTRWDVSLTHSSAPDLTLDQAIANEKRTIKDKLNKYPVWPLIKVQVSYAF